MSEIFDCSDEFKIRQQVNYVKRKLLEWGHTNVSVTLMTDETSETGIGIVLIDNASGASKLINTESLENVTNDIIKANSKSTYR